MYDAYFIDAGERELRHIFPSTAWAREPVYTTYAREIRKDFMGGCWLSGGEPYAAPFFPNF